MQVTRLKRADLPVVIRARALFDRPFSPGAALAYLEDDRNVFLLAMEADEPVGFLRGTALGQLASRRPQMFLYEIGVGARYRRRGIGRALVRALIEYCRARDFEEIFVLTDPSNTAAVGLYRETGARTETPGDRMFVYRLGRKTRRSRAREKS